MAKIGFKTFLIIAFLISSSISLPLMVSGQEYGVSSAPGTPDGGMMGNPSALWGGMGRAMGMFGQFGPAGDVLGKVIMTLFMQGLDISSKEMLPGVFVLNASMEDTHNWTEYYQEQDGRHYWVPWGYLSNRTEEEIGWGNPYCVVGKKGSVHYNFTSGAAVTFIIWDSDGSLIKALQKVIDVGKELFRMAKHFEENPPTEAEATKAATKMVGKIANVVSYLLIHINDIINGDELIMLNPITYQTLLITTGADFEITKTWYYANGSVIPEPLIAGWGWKTMAEDHNDEYMLWLLSKPDIASKRVKKWTHFTFDLIQLWIKNFHVEIDANAIMQLLSQAIPTGNGGGGGGTFMTSQDGYSNSGDPFEGINPAAIFDGCDIEFYLFTHHLSGAFLYNDENEDGKITVEYVNVTDEDGNPIMRNNTYVQVPKSTEVTHRIHLGEVDDFEVKEPTINKNEFDVPESISWGMQMNDVNISTVPLCVEMEDYVGDIPEENLDFIFFGFTFIPNITDSVEIKEDGVTKTIQLASGKVKLDQYFAPWNDGEGPNADISGLDMAFIYLSTALHIHFNLSLDEVSQEKILAYDEQRDHPMLTEDDYHEEEHALYIGNYMPEAPVVPFVDIAGPYYDQVSPTNTTQYPASTSIIPLGLFEAGVSDFSTHMDEETPSASFTSEAFIQTEFNVMLYSVNYPTFDGSGDGILHDPVFSVFMTWEAQSIISIVLLLGGITLIGVATILITRRKNKLIR